MFFHSSFELSCTFEHSFNHFLCHISVISVGVYILGNDVVECSIAKARYSIIVEETSSAAQCTLSQWVVATSSGNPVVKIIRWIAVESAAIVFSMSSDLSLSLYTIYYH